MRYCALLVELLLLGDRCHVLNSAQKYGRKKELARGTEVRCVGSELWLWTAHWSSWQSFMIVVILCSYVLRPK